MSPSAVVARSLSASSFLQCLPNSGDVLEPTPLVCREQSLLAAVSGQPPDMVSGVDGIARGSSSDGTVAMGGRIPKRSHLYTGFGIDDEERSEYPDHVPYLAVPAPLGHAPWESNALLAQIKLRAVAAQNDADRAQRAAELAVVRTPSIKRSIEGTERAVRGILYAKKVAEGQSDVANKLSEFQAFYDPSNKDASKAIKFAEQAVNMLDTNPRKKQLEREAAHLFEKAHKEYTVKDEFKDCESMLPILQGRRPPGKGGCTVQ